SRVSFRRPSGAGFVCGRRSGGGAPLAPGYLPRPLRGDRLPSEAPPGWPATFRGPFGMIGCRGSWVAQRGGDESIDVEEEGAVAAHAEDAAVANVEEGAEGEEGEEGGEGAGVGGAADEPGVADLTVLAGREALPLDDLAVPGVQADRLG